MTVTDIALTIPGLVLVIVLAVILDPKGPFLIGIVLSINAWAGLARAIRSEVLSLRHESYVEASRVLGLSTSKILRQDVIPNLMPYITMNFVQAARTVIFGSVGLFFLGILTSSAPNWGKMMNLAYSTAGALYTLDTAHWLIMPMLTIILFSLGLTLFAQGADRLFNPRIQARHSDSTPDESSEDDAGEATTVGTNSGGTL
jgi:peptide/nickel transport system permease protein